MLSKARRTPAEAAILTVFTISEYDQEKSKTTTRARIQQATLRILADRQRLRAAFVEDWIDELANLGWSTFPVGDGFGVIKTEAVSGWVRIGSKRIRPTLDRIRLGDESAFDDVMKAVLPEELLEDNEDD